VHELALTESVVRAIRERLGEARVVRVRLEVGRMVALMPEALRFCFDAVARGGLAAGARLDVVTTPGLAWCMPCGDRVPLARLGDACPVCGSYQLTVVAGEEMRVKEIEIA
jgi:hydrogenase nickel incorporation protein HypA/HybF